MTWVGVAGFETGGLFVPKPGTRVSILGNSVSNLGLSVRQRPLVCVGACSDRHSVGHSVSLPANAGLSVNGRPADSESRGGSDSPKRGSLMSDATALVAASG